MFQVNLGRPPTLVTNGTPRELIRELKKCFENRVTSVGDGHYIKSLSIIIKCVLYVLYV